MIYFVTTRKHDYTIQEFLASYGEPLKEIVQPLSYRQLFRSVRLSSGTYVFADIERLANRNAHRALHVWDHLAQQHDCRLLNHPLEALRRYELHKTLYDRGINRFRSYRYDENLAKLQFPVFLRGENNHKGPMSSLLEDSQQMYQAMRQLRKTYRGRRANLITEFIDTAGQDGVYRKYSAFKVAGEIIARHVFFGREWSVKFPAMYDAKCLGEELSYVEQNPHRQQLDAIFRAAKIDFGRIDYGIKDGQIQVWEINTNPRIATGEDRQWTDRLPIQEIFTKRFNQAWMKCNCDSHAHIRIDQPQRRQLPRWNTMYERVWNSLYV